MKPDGIGIWISMKNAPSNLTNSFSYQELAALKDGHREGACWFRADQKLLLADFRARHDNTDVFTSICRFTRPDQDSAHVCDFYLAVRAADLAIARDDILRACELLMERLEMPPQCLDLAFTGSDGFDLVVPLKVFGQPANPGMLVMWRALAQRLAREGCNHADVSVYQPSGLLRLPNSIDSKTGGYKVPLEYAELKDLGLDYVLELARQPREDDNMAIPEECPKATWWFQKAVIWSEIARRRQWQSSRMLRPPDHLSQVHGNVQSHS